MNGASSKNKDKHGLCNYGAQSVFVNLVIVVSIHDRVVIFLSLGREDPLEEGVATHSSILAWRISMDRGVWWATVHGVTESQVGLSD